MLERCAGASTLILLVLMPLGCPIEVGPGGFEDGVEETGLLPPDLPQPQCDPKHLDDCEAGFKCSYVAEGPHGPTNRCVELLGKAAEGEPCTLMGDSDTCANHLLCWGADGSGQGGECVSFCTLALQCPQPETFCSVSNAGLLFLCLRECDPVVQDCGEGWGCYPDDNLRWSCDRDQSAEAGAHADPCGCLNCCDPGLVCMAGGLVDGEACGSDGAEGCCAQVCDLEDLTEPELQCPSESERCRDFYDPSAVLMGYEHVGVCEL